MFRYAWKSPGTGGSDVSLGPDLGVRCRLATESFGSDLQSDGAPAVPASSRSPVTTVGQDETSLSVWCLRIDDDQRYRAPGVLSVR